MALNWTVGRNPLKTPPLYRICIFCSADLGDNEAVEEFPVGRALAFDAWKGRLWAVCPRCTRWNLAPIEERWEAVESAEKQFRGSRLRVHSENIGLARLPDGTRLIRVGEALPRELAAWRYGDELVRRRKQALLWGGLGLAGVAVVSAGTLAAAGVAAALPAVHLVVNGGSIIHGLWLARHQHRVVHRVPASASPTGEEIAIRAIDLRFARFVPGPDNSLALQFPDLGFHQRVEEGNAVRWVPPPPIRLEGDDAERIAAKALIRVNRAGASAGKINDALNRLGESETREAFLRRIAEQRSGLFSQWSATNPVQMPDIKGGLQRFLGTFRGERVAARTVPLPPPQLPEADRLALEMALHEESERRALEGELAALEAAWREAEETAQIADVLPDDPLKALRA